MRWETGVEDDQLVAFLDHVPFHVTVAEAVDPVGNLHSANCTHPCNPPPEHRMHGNRQQDDRQAPGRELVPQRWQSPRQRAFARPAIELRSE
jgi:hypothetical protein